MGDEDINLRMAIFYTRIIVTHSDIFPVCYIYSWLCMIETEKVNN